MRGALGAPTHAALYHCSIVPVAEQVEKVSPDLVARDADGKINTARYEAVNAMLLNEFLKEAPQSRGTRSDDRAVRAGLPVGPRTATEGL
jgi:hypothetical protein